MENRYPPSQVRRDLFFGALLFVSALALYVRTLAPSVAFLFDDTLEFQYIVPRLGIIHQTGYPLYALLGKLFTLAVPLNDPAFRLNLLSAVDGALAVAMVYFVARHLTSTLFAAVIAALTFAVGQTFWSQAVIAETYTTQMLLVAILLYLALIWKEETERGNVLGARRRFYTLAFAMGLGLTHHRLIVLLYPALALYLLVVNRNILRDGKTLARAVFLFVLPLLFYVYLPLRGSVGSADGTYENTLQGFLAWVTAQQYTIFLTDNPLLVQRDAGYYTTLFQNQFGILGLALGAVGFVWLLHRPREWILLVLALTLQAIFVFNYRVENVYVHFLTTFLLLSLIIAAGADGLLNTIGKSKLSIAGSFLPSAVRLAVAPFATIMLTVLLLLIPLNLVYANFAANDLSTKWDVRDYGLDILSQPLEKDSTVIGLLGEMTLLRYFQETQGIRPDIRTIAADREDERLAAVDRAIQDNRIVYLTRPLKNLAAKYSLSSLGPLVRVHAQPTPAAPKVSHPIDDDFAPSVKLLGYDLNMSLNSVPDGQHAETGRFVRVTFYWQPVEKIKTDALVSVKLIGQDARVVGQIDRRPVTDAYPTTAWRAGEVIADTYAVPVFLGAPPGEYNINVTLYDGKTGTVIGQRNLQKIPLAPDLVAPRADAWNIAHIADANFGPFALAGYSLDTDAPIRPGDALPLTVVWRAGTAPVKNSLITRIWLEDHEGKAIASRDTPMGESFPVSQWQTNQYVRDWPAVRIPANVADGQYTVKLATARGNNLLGIDWLPIGSTIVRLGEIQIKNRPRVMTAAPVPNPFDAIFDKKIKLVGYDIQRDIPARGVRLTLYWRSLAVMDTSYTVFVHLLDSKNTVLAAADALPGGGEFPTTGWLEGEFIADVHSFTLPPDLPEANYPIEIGLYDADTGARLKTAAGQDRVVPVSINIP